MASVISTIKLTAIPCVMRFILSAVFLSFIALSKVTFESAINDIKTADRMNLITHGIAVSLIVDITDAMKVASKNNADNRQNKLDIAQHLLQVNQAYIDKVVHQALIYDLKT